MVGNHGKELFVFLGINFGELLGQGFLWQRKLSRVAGIRSDKCGRRQLVCPNGYEFGLGARKTCESEGDTTGVDEEVELSATECGYPLGPGNVDRGTGSVDGTRRGSRGGQSKAAATGPTKGVVDIPGGGVVWDEIGLKDHLELREGDGRKGLEEGTGEERDGMSDGLREICRGRSHWKKSEEENKIRDIYKDIDRR
jgi:hypothetical protein